MACERESDPVKFLFVVPPLTGHVNPTVSVARSLAAEGHEVAWAGYEHGVRPLLPPGATLYSVGEHAEMERIARTMAGSHHLRGLESLQFFWQEFVVPLARTMRPDVSRVIDDLAPDVIVVDQQAVGGALAARRSGRPWATSCTTSAGVTNPLASLPKVQEWVDARLAELESEAGLPRSATPDLSPQRVIVFSTEALVGPLAAFPRTHRFVGPSIQSRPDDRAFPWEALDPARKKILVSLGTVSAERGGDFYDVVVQAFADTPWQVVLVAPEGRVAAPPASFIVRPRVPQLQLLPHMAAVVSHGGHNTVCESLAHGVPLVVTPIRDDQPVIAEQVVNAQAGLRLKFGRRLAPADLRAAVARLLDEPGFAAAAARVRDSFAAAGGAPAAARLLVELAG
jgi:MGT family glycosyltransferase